MSKNQKGFSAIEALLIIVILGMIGGTGWYVWHAKQSADATLGSAASIATTNSSSTIRNSNQQANYIDEKNGFSFNYEAGRRPTIGVVAEDVFSLKNLGGGNLTYDTTKKQFITIDASNVTEVFQPTLKAGGSDIYIWDEADAGTVLRTYIIHLKNQKILTVANEYSLELKDDATGKIEQPGLTDSEYSAQKAKDQQSILTFKYL